MPLPPPTTAQVKRLARRVARRLTKRARRYVAGHDDEHTLAEPDERALVMDEGHAELDGVLLFDTVFADPEAQGVSDLLDAGGEFSLYDDGQPPFPPDSHWSLEQPFTFRTWFATNPDVVSAGIGLDQSQFDAGTGLPN